MVTWRYQLNGGVDAANTPRAETSTGHPRPPRLQFKPSTLAKKGETHMQVKVPKLILTTMAVVSFTGTMALAGSSSHHHSNKSATVDIVGVMKVPGGPTLQSGSYRVALLSPSSVPEIGFYQEGKLVGQAPVKLVDQGKKISETEVLTNAGPNHTNVLTEMDLSGWTQKLMFGTSPAMGG